MANIAELTLLLNKVEDSEGLKTAHLTVMAIGEAFERSEFYTGLTQVINAAPAVLSQLAVGAPDTAPEDLWEVEGDAGVAFAYQRP